MRLLLPPLHARTRTASSPRHLSSEALAEDLEGGEGRIGLSGYGVAVPRRFARDDAGLVEHLAAHSLPSLPAFANIGGNSKFDPVISE